MKTGFAVPFGLFEYVWLPFGLSNTPATFQRMMQRCLGDLCYTDVVIYLDDIIVFLIWSCWLMSLRLGTCRQENCHYQNRCIVRYRGAGSSTGSSGTMTLKWG